MKQVTSVIPGHPWDLAAEGWDRHAALINDWLRDITDSMLRAAGIGPGSRVLDVAAGAGGQTLDIARRVDSNGQVLATDISARILQLAAINAQRAGLAQIETRVADAQALGLTGSGFDAAVSRLGLMFCPQPLEALREIASALRPGGRIAAVVFSGPQANPCISILASTARRHAGLPPGSPFEPGTLCSLGKPGLAGQLLEQAGFSDVRVEPVAAPLQLPTARHYLDFVRSSASPILEILAPLPELARDSAWADMEAQLNCFSGEGGWRGPNELLLCSGRRAGLLTG
jgi:ubiquinone/menaquinone biosynthesis C-methylase UbiE